jgi:hypothetical protein
MPERITTPSRLAAAVLAAALSLAACTNSQSASNASNAAAVAEPSAAAAVPPPVATPAAKNPCDLPGGWFFKGSCALELVTPAGATFALPAYRGVGVELAYGASDVRDKVPFVAGDAVGTGDVAGLLNGTIEFAPYGRANCLSLARKPVPCAGSALIYIIVVNGGRVPVKFKASPSIRVASANGFPGKDCGIDTMVWHAGKPAWLVHPYSSAPNGNELRIDPRAQPQTYASGGSFTVFAIVCG